MPLNRRLLLLRARSHRRWRQLYEQDPAPVTEMTPTRDMAVCPRHGPVRAQRRVTCPERGCDLALLGAEPAREPTPREAIVPCRPPPPTVSQTPTPGAS